MVATSLGTVLIVEDDEGIAELERMQLESCGYDARVAATAVDGLEEIRRGGIDLVLLDFRLQGEMDGLEFYARVKSEGLDPPVILVTGFGNEATIIQALRAGVRDFVTKSAEYLDYLPEAVGQVLRQVRTENRLADSEARLAALIASAKDAIIIVESDHRISLFNAAAERMFRCSEGLAQGRNVEEFLPLDVPKITDPAVLAGGSLSLVRQRVRGIRADGTEFPLEASVARAQVDGRQFYTIMVRDITERRRAENALRRSERQFRAVFDQAAVGIALVAPDRKLLAANPGFCQIVGYAKEDMKNLNVDDLTHNDDRDREEPFHRAVLVGEMDTYTVEKRYVRKSGRTVWVSLTASAVRSESGAIEYIVKIVEEITDRRRAEERLREQARLLDWANEAIIVTDLTGQVRYWNQGAERLYEWTAAEMIGSPEAALYHDADLPVLESSLRSLLAGGEWSGELPHITKTGRNVLVESHWTLVRDDDGHPATFLKIDSDVTSKRHLEQRLQQAQKMEAIGVLAGGVAHDFNNVLTIVQGYSEILLTNPHLNSEVRELVTEIHRAGEHAASLTRQLLAFSRQQMIAPTILDVNSQVRGMEKMLSRLLGADIELTSSLDPRIGAVKADSGQLEQVIMNLAVNARDAMPRGGRLTIETKNVELDEEYVKSHVSVKHGPYVLLAVTDSGVGMDTATRARIFEPFFTTKAPGKGTGLGLATVFGIVQQSGGHLDVYSELGRGTTFKVYLPRLTDGSKPSSASRSASAIKRGTETVLVADDDPGVRALARLVLEASGYTVLEAVDGESGLRVGLAYTGPIQLLMTDVVMPKVSGRELANRLQVAQPGIRVLYVSGYTDDAIVRHGVLEEKMAFLQKPFTPSLLTSKVREVLDSVG